MEILNEYKIPAYFASAIVNNDYTGLSDEETKILDNFLNTLSGYLVIKDIGIEPYFSRSNNITSSGGDVIEFLEIV